MDKISLNLSSEITSSKARAMNEESTENKNHWQTDAADAVYNFFEESKNFNDGTISA